MNLTERQTQVARLIAEGDPSKVIAHKLTLAESTVKVHIRHIFEKLEVTNRTQAALKIKDLEL